MCAIAGIFGAAKAAELLFVAQHAQQHRATDSAGIVTSDGVNLYHQTGSGIIQDAFTQSDLDKLHGQAGISHLRYSTVEDEPSRDNTQPIKLPFGGAEVAIAHNGNLINLNELVGELPEGVSLKTSMDTEVILRRLCLAAGSTIEDMIINALRGVRGSYSLLFLLPDRLVAVRDAAGNRPLSLGRRGDAYCIASETCALDAIDAKFVRDIEPGEIVTIDESGLRSTRLPWTKPHCQARCIFEKIYYAHPVSRVFSEEADDEAVADFRFRLGQELERIYPVLDGEIVMPVPSSAQFMALGYADSGRSGRFSPSIQRSHYVGRSFIEPNRAMRDLRVARKFSLIQAGIFGIKGRVITVVDDSIVRATTMPHLIAKIRAAGPKAIHARIACPPITHSCRYGIDTPSTDELASARWSQEIIRQRLGVDSLEFLPLEALQKLSRAPEHYCFTCMNGVDRMATIPDEF